MPKPIDYVEELQQHIVNSVSGDESNPGFLRGYYGDWECSGFSEERNAIRFVLDYKAEAEDERVLEVKINSRGLNYFFRHKPSSTRFSGHAPVRWSGDLDDDLNNFYEYMDSVLQIVEGQVEGANMPKAFDGIPENPEYSKRGPTPKKVPLSQFFKTEPGSSEPTATEPAGPAKPTSWRGATDEREIARLFPRRPKYDEVIDLYQLARGRKSNFLMNLAKERSAVAESTMRARKANALVEKLLESGDQRQFELRWKKAQDSARLRPDWAVLRQAISAAMVDDGAEEVGTSDLSHAVMRYWEQYVGDWDQFLKDHPLQPGEAQCDNCGASSHHTEECPYSFGANPQ